VRALVENAATALADPTRADAVAAVGELTGAQALRKLLRLMQDDPGGREILLERPVVSKDTIPYEELIAQANIAASSASGPVDGDPPPATFGQAYGTFLASHGFDPDGRDPIRHLEDPDLAYVMLRYRQCHDYWHALTGLPPTVAGELGLKWLELFQTGLPLTALSSTAASLRLDPRDRRLVWNAYLPWAYRLSKRMKFGSLLMVHYEKEFDTPLEELRDRLGIVPAPSSDMAAENTEKAL
jgi:ubiquinone biosynthesis protein COQ4